MLKSFVSDMIHSQSSDFDIYRIADDFSFFEYCQSDEYACELQRITNPLQVHGDLSDIIGDRNSISIIDTDALNVSLSTPSKMESLVYSQTAPCFVVLMEGANRIKVDLFQTGKQTYIDPIDAVSSKIEHVGDFFIERFAPWTPPSRDLLYKIAPQDTEHVILTVNGAHANHYFHAYSLDNGAYMYSAFSSHRAASQFYLSEILAGAVFDRDFSIVRKRKLTKAAVALARRPEMPTTGVWRLAEAMARLDRDKLPDILEILVARGGGIGAKAKSALTNLQKELQNG